MIINDIIVKLAEALGPAADAMDSVLLTLPEGHLRDQTTAAVIALQETYQGLMEDMISEIAERRMGNLTGIPEQPSNAETLEVIRKYDFEEAASS